MKTLLKKLAGLVLGDYAAYHVFSCADARAPARDLTGFSFAIIDQAQVWASADALIRDQAGYHGCDAYAYACLADAQIVGLCYFWFGCRYRERNFWPLRDREAKLVQIVTVPAMRGRAIAPHLIAFASADMFARGFERLYARVWHSNTRSSRAFRRAGWERVATVIEMRPLARRHLFRMTLKRHRGHVGSEHALDRRT